MIYMTPQSGSLSFNDPYNELYGIITTPSRYGKMIPQGRIWCADNEVFTGKFEWQRYKSWLQKMLPHQRSCVFVVAPDVVADASATITQFAEYGPKIRALGYPVAFAAQDGQQNLSFPDFDALFIGGSTEWKLSEAADYCIRYAQKQGKWTHVGRVNSQKRIRHFQIIGVDSVDGTHICFAPDKNIKVLNKQLLQPALFTIGDNQERNSR